MSKELEALKDLTVSAMCCGAMEMSLVEKNNAVIEQALKDLNTIKECISFNSFGDLVLTQYGKVHYDLLREVLR